jgi:hypothetical protein
MNVDRLKLVEFVVSNLTNYPKLNCSIDLRIAKHMHTISRFVLDNYHGCIIATNVRRVIVEQLISTISSLEKLVAHLNVVEDKL